MRFSAILTVLTVILGGSLLSGMAVANNVIVVDAAGGPGTDYLSVGNAVYYAEDGDTILIKPGVYTGAHINEKSLTLIGDGAERPSVGVITVWLPDENQQVVLRGLVGDASVFDSQALHIQHCLGSVSVEDCVFEVDGNKGQHFSSVRIENSEKVTITRCSISGPDGYLVIIGPGSPGAPGLTTDNSNVYLYDTSIAGGAGADAEYYEPWQIVQESSPGGPAVTCQGGLLLLAGCDVTAGDGGNGLEFSGQGYPSSDGGDGIVVDGSVKTLDSTVAGGAAGMDPPGYPQVGVDGVAFNIQGGSVDTINESYRSYESESPVRNGDSALVTVTGVPGEPVWLLLSLDPGFVYFPKYRGVLVPDLPLTIFYLGGLPPSGTLQFSVPVNMTFPPGTESLTFYEQVIVPAQSYGGVLSSPTVAVIVDSQY